MGHNQSRERNTGGTVLPRLAGAFSAVCLIFVLMVSSIELVCYYTPGWFETEYEKHDVLSTLPEMTMSETDGLMAVTNHMMKYLRGDADTPDLQIEVQMGGEKRGFFTEREIAHMIDVRALFVKAIRLRRLFLLTAAALTAACIPGFRKGTALRPYGQGVLIGTAVVFAALGALSAYAVSDFTRFWIRFHHVFFTNDLWLLDPAIDMLVNIVPEGFFFDTVLRTFTIFGAGLLVMLAISVLMIRKGKKAEQNGKA